MSKYHANVSLRLRRSKRVFLQLQFEAFYTVNLLNAKWKVVPARNSGWKERAPISGYMNHRQSLLSLHMTKSYVRTATRSTLKVDANLTQILNFKLKANFHTEFEPFFKKKFMLTMVDTLRLSA